MKILQSKRPRLQGWKWISSQVVNTGRDKKFWVIFFSRFKIINLAQSKHVADSWTISAWTIIRSKTELCILYITSPLITASLNTIKVVFPKVGGTGGPSESSRYPPQCWMTCRTHVIPRYFDLFMPLRTGVAAFEERWLRVLLRDVRAGGAFETQASLGAGLPRRPGPGEENWLCWRYRIIFRTFA